jgi:DEAD/DEAH box helicase domain-containing protein
MSEFHQDIEVITADGAPSGRKEFIVWNPPLIDDLEPLSGRVSSLAEACGLFRFLIKRGVRTILFCKVCQPLRFLSHRTRRCLSLIPPLDSKNL